MTASPSSRSPATCFRKRPTINASPAASIATRNSIRKAASTSKRRDGRRSLDRVNTTATVWLGSTVACAQCHNHKYDPFSQRDYYRLLAFFDNVEYSVFGKPGRRPLHPGTDARPAVARTGRPAQRADRRNWPRSTRRSARLAPRSTPARPAGKPPSRRRCRPGRCCSRRARRAGAATLTVQPDGSVLASGLHRGRDEYRAGRHRAGRPNHRPSARGAARPLAAQGRARAATTTATSCSPGLPSTVSTTAGSATRLTFNDVKTDDGSGADVKALIQLTPRPYLSEDPGGWAIDATRDDTRVSRQIVFVCWQAAGARPPGTNARDLVVRQRQRRAGHRPVQALGDLQ